MWKLVGRYAVKLALWALEHPDTVKAAVDELHKG